MIKEWESKINIVETKDIVFHESPELRLDSSKAENLLSWKGILDIDEIIEKIVKWEKSSNGKEGELISFQQINSYFEK